MVPVINNLMYNIILNFTSVYIYMHSISFSSHFYHILYISYSLSLQFFLFSIVYMTPIFVIFFFHFFFVLCFDLFCFGVFWLFFIFFSLFLILHEFQLLKCYIFILYYELITSCNFYSYIIQM